MSLHGDEQKTRARTYDGIHKALNRVRGRAAGWPCSHPMCDRQATGWGLYGPPTHIGGNSHGKQVRWSIHLDAYRPMCPVHNAQRDHGGTWSTCARGHARIAWGVDSRGTCRGCQRERGRAHTRRG